VLRRIVIVGGSLAGLRAAQTLRDADYTGDVVIVGAEDAPAYQRPPLSKQFLAGQWDESRVFLRWGNRTEVEHRRGVTATGLDPERSEVRLSTGECLVYDGLVIATGARPVLPAAWGGLAGVHTLRTLADAAALRSAFAARPRVVVVGAGFIGLEVAATACQLGLEVTVIEAATVPLRGMLGPEVGELLLDAHRARDVRIVLGTAVGALLGGDAVSAVELVDGRVIDADLVVVGVGVSPCTEWLRGSGLPVDDGVICDASCAVEGHANIVAAGDVARWFHRGYGVRLRVEHWDNAVGQAIHAARRLLHGPAYPAYVPVPSFWSDQYGSKYQLVGRCEAAERVTFAEGSAEQGKFVATYHSSDTLTGACAVNLPVRAAHYTRLLGDRWRSQDETDSSKFSVIS
jgi:NADPH-dependent 2,4-dienoyl-CoA reductase/sulfur reductase-like enzyme